MAGVIALILGLVIVSALLAAFDWVCENFRKLSKEEKQEEYRKRSAEIWERTRHYHDGR